VTINFKERLKPQIIWIAQPQEKTNMATSIRVFISEDVFWEINEENGLIADFVDEFDKNWQEFKFEKTQPLVSLKVEVLNI